MKKKIGIGIILVLCIAGSVWAGGANEKNQKVKTDDLIIINADYNAGSTKISMQFKSTIQYAILKIGNNYYNPFFNTQINTSFANEMEKIFAYTKSGTIKPIYKEAFDKYLLNANYWDGATQIDWSSYAALANTTNTMPYYPPANQKTLNFTIHPDNPVKRHELLIIYSATGIALTYQRLEFDLISEFFNGENEFFQRLDEGWKKTYPVGGTVNYNEKALIFMNLLWDGDTSFKDMVKNDMQINISDTKWNNLLTCFQPPDGQELNSYLGELKSAFKQAFALHFHKYYEEGYPILISDRITFESIYCSNRNIYVNAYLLYLYKNNKPVYSFIYQQLLKQTGVPYDYRQYKKINEIKTSNEYLNIKFIKSALKYLTWGVEYTAFPDEESVQITSSGNKVYINNEIDKWVDNINSNRENNYHYNSAKTVKLIAGSDPESDYTYDTNKLAFVGNDNAANYIPIKASRIDIWTADNLSWNSNLVDYDNIIVKNGNNEDLNYPSNVKQRIVDKIIAKGETSNLHIDKTNIDTVKIGLSFKVPVTVKAVCLVRGESVVRTTAQQDKTLKKYLDIEYKTETAGGVIEGTQNSPGGFYELVSIPYNNPYSAKGKVEFDKYGDEEGLAGKGIYTGFYSMNNSQIIYDYLILKQPIENCKELVIVDKTGNSFLNITEFLLFDENPLAYRFIETKAGKTIIKEDYIDFIESQLTPGYEVFQNYDLAKEYTLSQLFETFYLTFTDSYPVKQIVAWENTGNNTAGAKELKILNGYYVYAEPIPAFLNILQELNNSISGITTPFMVNKKYKYGNPLPYAYKGIDSPRTFAYKMNEQYKARAWLRDLTNNTTLTDGQTTLALIKPNIIDYFDGYIDETEVFAKLTPSVKLETKQGEYIYKNYPTNTLPKYSTGNLIKPFLPGLYPNNLNSRIEELPSLYAPDKTGGVDSLGMVSGAIAMAGLDNILTVNNTSIGAALDKYYRMEKSTSNAPTAQGLGVDGKPVYYSTPETSYLKGDYRLSFRDIERATVIVPDISLIKPGDLIIRSQQDQNPHIGIVVGLLWETTPPYMADVRQYWDKVIVLSVGKGFRTVTLGKWSNMIEEVFGGFTKTPGEYYIRRFVSLTGTQDIKNLPFNDWELVNKLSGIKIKNYAYYLSEVPEYSPPPLGWYSDYTSVARNQYPYNYENGEYKISFTSEKDDNNVTYNLYTTNEIYDNSLVWFFTIMNGDRYFFLNELPTTSFYDTSESSFFKEEEYGNNITTKIIDRTGFRVLERDSYPTYNSTEPYYTRQLEIPKKQVPNLYFYTNLKFNTNLKVEKEEGLKLESGASVTSDDVGQLKILTFTLKIKNNPVMIKYGNCSLKITPNQNTTKGKIELFTRDEPGVKVKKDIDLALDKVYTFTMSITLNKNDTTISVEQGSTKMEYPEANGITGSQITLKSEGTAYFNNVYAQGTLTNEENMAFKLKWLSYHMGADVVSSGSLPPGITLTDETGMGWDIYAPESGVFYIMNNGVIDDPVKLILPEGNELSYSNTNYKEGTLGSGLIGVLVTNPESPRDGRIYLLNHMGSRAEGASELPYKNLYEDKYGIYPNGWEDRNNFAGIKVKTGEWIGKVGRRGSASSMHIHLEVMEYFDKVIDLNNKNIITGNNNNNGWRFIDPITCLYPKTTSVTDGYMRDEKWLNPVIQKINADPDKFKKSEFKDQIIRGGK